MLRNICLVSYFCFYKNAYLYFHNGCRTTGMSSAASFARNRGVRFYTPGAKCNVRMNRRAPSGRDFPVPGPRGTLEACYPEADRTILVADNLDTHTLGTLYETFPLAEAGSLAAHPGLDRR